MGSICSASTYSSSRAPSVRQQATGGGPQREKAGVVGDVLRVADRGWLDVRLWDVSPLALNLSQRTWTPTFRRDRGGVDFRKCITALRASIHINSRRRRL